MAPSRGFHSDNPWVNMNYDKKMKAKREMEEQKTKEAAKARKKQIDESE